MSLGITGSAPVFKSALNYKNTAADSKNADSEQLSWAEQSDIERNQKKLQEEQAKAAEDLKRKQQQEQERKEKENELDMLERELKASREEAKAMEDSFKMFAKCLKIASRISKGDIVPMKDMKYLAEHEPDLYKQAILMRVPNSKPKKHKSVLDEDDEKKDAQESADALTPDGASDMSAAEVVEAAQSASADTSADAGTQE